MSTIVPSAPSVVPLLHARSASADREETIDSLRVRSPRSMAQRFRQPMAGRMVACVVVSLALHGVAMAALGYVGQRASWRWIAVESGRASIELVASIAAASSRGEPEAEVLPIPISPADELARDDPRPAATEVERRTGATALPPIRLKIDAAELILLAEVEVSTESDSAEMPHRAEPANVSAEAESRVEHQVRRTNVGLRHARELTEQVADSLPSVVSNASRGADSDSPEAVFNPAPQYPAEALAARLTGRVVVRVKLTAGGTVAEAVVHQSSGSALLDEAAAAAVRSWRFSMPGGSMVRELAVPISFVIQDQP